ncbi:MAG TPA: hypothetical protein VMD48_04980, partial [Solirubrobacteraceae bacterium]|nr:hypothetical protein [Solirubrobacteraceae bacterium]
GERDPEQVRLAIEGVRAHLPLIEDIAPEQAAQIRDALSQMQLAYVRIGGTPTGGESEGPNAAAASAAPAGEVAPEPLPEEPVKPGEPGPAQRSGRLWIPGQ